MVAEKRAILAPMGDINHFLGCFFCNWFNAKDMRYRMENFELRGFRSSSDAKFKFNKISDRRYFSMFSAPINVKRGKTRLNFNKGW